MNRFLLFISIQIIVFFAYIKWMVPIVFSLSDEPMINLAVGTLFSAVILSMDVALTYNLFIKTKSRN